MIAFYREPCPYSPPTTGHVVVVLRLSPLPQFLRDVVKKLAREGGTPHPENPIGALYPNNSIVIHNNTSYIACHKCFQTPPLRHMPLPLFRVAISAEA